jgi:hypothetical protein
MLFTKIHHQLDTIDETVTWKHPATAERERESERDRERKHQIERYLEEECSGCSWRLCSSYCWRLIHAGRR